MRVVVDFIILDLLFFFHCPGCGVVAVVMWHLLVGVVAVVSLGWCVEVVERVAGSVGVVPIASGGSGVVALASRDRSKCGPYFGLRPTHGGLEI